MSESSTWLIAGRYRVLGRVGAGGMADVLRAHDEMLDRDVAVKVFRSTPPGPDGTADTASGVERQRAELAALARLNHPNLTMLYDGSIVGQQGPAYLVMELIDGPSLAQAITDGGLNEAQARVIGAQIADALAYVHGAGMVHRDVKPANILLGTDRNHPSESVRARLTDFGIVRLVGSEPLTQVDMTLGSASYLAPEQARGSAVGPPADIYALGLTLIEALTGRRSFDGPALEAVVARLSTDPEIPNGLPEPWPALLRAMTARDPAQRPPATRVAATLRGSESLTAPITSVPAGTFDTAVLPALGAAGAASQLPPRPPASRVTGASRTAARPVEPQPRRWSASLIVAGILVLALIVAGIALLVANSGGGSGSTPPSNRTSPTTSQTTASPSRSTPSKRRTSSRPRTSSSAPESESTSPTSSPTSSSSAPSTSSKPSSSAPSTSATKTSSTPSSTASATRARSSSAAAAALASRSAPATSTP